MLKSLRQENVHSDIFTPRPYQVELLEAALKTNTIVCLGTGTGKTFIAVMVIKELAHQLRAPFGQGGKRTVMLVDNIPLMEQQAKVVQMHTDLTVGKYPDVDPELLSQSQLDKEMTENQVIILTAHMFLEVLKLGFVQLSSVNLLICDECHLALENHPYVQIMQYYALVALEERPRVLAVTASVLNRDCVSPQQLQSNISELEAIFHSTAETASDILLADLFAARPKEFIIDCEPYVDQTGLRSTFAYMIESLLEFIQDVSLPEEQTLTRNPRQVAVTFLTECHHVLHVLGPWCAGRIARSLIKPLGRLEEHEQNEMSRRFLSLTLTLMRHMDQIVEDVYDSQVQCLEDFHTFMSPKVLLLFQILQEFKPDDNFIIIGDDAMDMESLESDDDSLNLSEDEAEFEKNKQNNVHYVAVKRVQPENTSPKVEDVICGIVFVERRHTAFALNELLVELCNWDPDLFFIKSHHIIGNSSRKGGERDLFYKRQEDILRKFRQKELNLLISTNALEEGVDIPKCNLIVRFDLPLDYRSYVQSKGRARASNSKYYMLVDETAAEHFKENIEIFKGIEKILVSKCHSRELTNLDPVDDEVDEEKASFYVPTENTDGPRVTMATAIGLVNQYCAKLPSDAFTHLTPKCTVTETATDLSTLEYIATLQLPINSPIKEPIQGKPMKSKRLAKMCVALLACEILHKAGELDNDLQPVGKEIIKYEDDENEWEEAELHGQARPGTTKRKQYYRKRLAKPLLGQPRELKCCHLYSFNMKLTCPITDEQNTRGRKIHAPEDNPRGFGIITEHKMPLVPLFPVFTRSGEVTVSLDLVSARRTFTDTELAEMKRFHRFVFSNVLRLEKEPMLFDPDKADISYIVVPVTNDADNKITVDWAFMKEVDERPIKRCQRKYLFQAKKTKFNFNKEDFVDAVVMPSYRNIDQPQYFYVAEIRTDLNAKSGFPSPELYDTFEHYYRSKYGLELTNMEQPLLDVDHTSARLNLLTPRYMNQKGVALPTSSAETRRARRENLQQKQILLPELCDIHPFPASLWRKAVCIPAILYRINYLLIAEELRVLISQQAHIGLPHIPEDFRFPSLEFGFSTNSSDKKNGDEMEEALNVGNRTPGIKIVVLDSSDPDRNGQDVQPSEAVENTLGEIVVLDSSDPDRNDQNVQLSEAVENTPGEIVVLDSSDPDRNDQNVHPSEAVENTPGDSVESEEPKKDHCSETNKVIKINDGDVGISSKKNQTNEIIDDDGLPDYEIINSFDISKGPMKCDDSESSQKTENCAGESSHNSGRVCANLKSLCEAALSNRKASSYEAQSVPTPTNPDHTDDIKDDITGAVPHLCSHLCSNCYHNDHVHISDQKQAIVISESRSAVSTSSSDQSSSDACDQDPCYPMITFDKAVDLKTFIGPSPCTILQALTMSNANDFFNLERLETIGDSFLKFAITVYLYCSYPGIHEGKLSYLRSKQVSNYNLYKLGKKKKLPECMVAAKFEPTENWLPPGYVVKEDGAYKGLSVHITSLIDPGGQDQNEKQNGDATDGTEPYLNGKVAHAKMNGDTDGHLDGNRKDSSLSYSISKKEQEQFIKELTEVTDLDEGEKSECSQILKKLIPYNLQTQHSLPDKSIADCVEALIGCYLTTCGQLAALQLMSWLGLKVIPDRRLRHTSSESQASKDGKVPSFGHLQAPVSPLLKHVPNAEVVLESHLQGFEQFESNVQYKFRDRSYLLQAFTHASYHYNIVTDCYQRLEFLGDAILDYVITRHLFEDAKKHSPGILTDLRSALVNNNIFAALAVKWDFHKYFKAVSPQLFNVIDKFVSWQKDKDDEIGLEEFDDDDDDFDEDDIQEDSEDIEIPKALGDIFESVAGAIYLDSGMSLDTVWRVYYRMMQPQIDAFTEKIPKSPVRELLEMEPETAKFEKPERTMNGRIRVKVNVVGKGCFCGIGRNYRIAKSAAARRALKLIRQYQQHIAAQLLAAEKYKAICT